MGARTLAAASPSSTKSLLNRVRLGDASALSRLFKAQETSLRRWARGRWPSWARRAGDTRDLVQDAILQTFRRLDRFEDRGKGALQAYLRRAVANRIADELRSVQRRPMVELDGVVSHLSEPGPSPLDLASWAETERRYKAGLRALKSDERMLVVGRLEMGYSYEQLALVTDRRTPGAARVATRRAVVRLAERLADR